MGRDPGSGEARAPERNRRADMDPAGKSRAFNPRIGSARPRPDAGDHMLSPPGTWATKALDTSEAHSYTAALIVPGLIPFSPSVRGASIA